MTHTGDPQCLADHIYSSRKAVLVTHLLIITWQGSIWIVTKYHGSSLFSDYIVLK
ncbi:hypothetical protein BDV37DRAFT_265787 [Aspergillus pseudonomiae]|uniref:Uncharacterized protein n=1 Tax=Aspergillus pseudonomiae TaxID=1506151 RepID=A0A5N7CUN8_9EURO|nr:uncharacterized protein BDV37DRAFT_265787 [Aspergillus pseudonomiae]KAE8397368.1 hypothetical protein BDV37DRAFT_265787 [Aspergillus pseudonomiae]